MKRRHLALAVVSMTFSFIGIRAESPAISIGCGLVALVTGVVFGVRVLKDSR
ncbi:hypothetical protein [Cryptosporangium phraense]|uniref:hypothetical protein n=1 Tax=Cryptosporangium phraense TaxID=2593070 RepID=UPI0014796E59|nr:hypothetical protein [Cryptosporangium phraense]